MYGKLYSEPVFICEAWAAGDQVGGPEGGSSAANEKIWTVKGQNNQPYVWTTDKQQSVEFLST